MLFARFEIGQKHKQSDEASSRASWNTPRSDSRRGLSYASRMALSFALTSLMTVLVLTVVVTVVWGGVFSDYTRANISEIAQLTAQRLADSYEEDGEWSTEFLASIAESNLVSSDIGLQVMDEDGTILLTDSKGRRLKKLTGHRSAVTGLALQGGRLYSCSRDRTLRLWNLLEERTEPVTALQADAWLLCLALSPDRRQLFVGDSDGRLYRFSVAPDEMAGSIRQRLPRNFTPQEWKHYMGDGVPYETFIDPKH